MAENYTQGAVPEYKINIDNLLYQKIMHWIKKAPGEVSGLGKLTLDKHTGLIEIESAVLLKQENTGSTTDLDAAAVSKAMYELRNEPGHLNWWWHSHVDMQVFWSGVDMANIRDIGSQGFLVSTVFNKREEMLSSIYRKGDDFFPETFIDNLETNITLPAPDKDKTEIWDKEFSEKCTVKSYSYGAPPYGDYGSWAEEFERQGYKFNYQAGKWEKKTQAQAVSEDMGVDEDYWYNKDDVPSHKEPLYAHQDDDDSWPVTNDEAKIAAVIPELNEFGIELEKQTKEKIARTLLFRICSKIDKLNITDKKRSYELKKPYMHMFNTQFPGRLLDKKTRA